MVSSMYEFIKRRLGTKKTLAANESNEKTVKRWPVQGYNDIKRLNQSIHEKRDTDGELVISSSMKENIKCLMAANNTLIEIVSRAIDRIDKIESKQHQIT